MDEYADHDLGNVQSKNSETNFLLGEGEIMMANGQTLRCDCSLYVPKQTLW
jgi:hypothetical protein